MANIIINSPEKHAFNRSRERLEEARRTTHSISKVSRVGDLKITENATLKSGKKITVVVDTGGNSQCEENLKEKQKYVGRNLSKKQPTFIVGDKRDHEKGGIF